MRTPPLHRGHRIIMREPLHCLSPQLIPRIDQAVCRAGPYGEVRLVIVRGTLRFIQILVSENVVEPTKGDGAS